MSRFKPLEFLLETHDLTLNNIYLFRLVLVKKDDDLWLKLGSNRRQKPCVVVKIKDYNARNTHATLHHLEHNVKCASNKDVAHGSGTRHMFHTMLKFINHYHPSIKTIDLQDSSEVDCEGSPMELSNYKFITTGRTWYQSLIPSLSLSDEDIEEQRSKSLKVLESPLSTSFEKFLKNLKIERTDPSFQRYLTTEIKYELRQIFDYCITSRISWLKFFKLLADNPNFGCFFINHTMHFFRKSKGILDLDGEVWNFPLDSMQEQMRNVHIRNIQAVKVPKDFPVRIFEGGSSSSLQRRSRHLAYPRMHVGSYDLGEP